MIRHAILGAALLTMVGCDAAPPASDAAASNPNATAGREAASTQPAPAYDMLEELAARTEIAEEKILGLASAIPEEDYDWRPGDGVRSVAEVLIHVAADNYYLPVLMGVDAPAESGITIDFATVRAYQEQVIPRAQIIANLEASFRFLDEALEQTRADLDRPFQFAGTDFTVGSMWAQAITHLHEHLGQLIAYARSNDVVPPWSR